MIGIPGLSISRRRRRNYVASWLLRDNFTTDRAAGAVNGTAAEPGPGTRTAGSALALSSGNAVLTASANDLYSLSSVTRAAGVAMVWQATITDVTQTIEFGFDTDQTGAIAGSALRITGDALRTYSGGVAGPTVYVPADSTAYKFAQILRAAGQFVFVWDGTNWLYLGAWGTNNTATLYPGWNNTSALGTIASLNVARLNWLPSPLTSDGFGGTFGTSDGLGHAETSGLGAGGGGKTWTGATWANSGGKASNTPTQGSELVTNGGFSGVANGVDVTTLAGWGPYGSPTARDIQNEKFHILATANGQGAVLTVNTTPRTWYYFSASVEGDLGNNAIYSPDFGDASSLGGNIRVCVRVPGSSLLLYFRAKGNAAGETYYDNVSVKALTLSTLFASTTHSTADVLVTAALTLTSGTQAGVVVNLDSAGSPANFVIAYHDGTNCKLEKCVAGTYTSVISAAATYSAGAEIRVIKDGTAYRLYYNNALVGTGTISDAGVKDNTLHGIFSTYSANTIDDFTVYARSDSSYNTALNEVANG